VNLEHVESYLAVLRTGSFHAAAHDRGLSQASVSHHVRALEEQQGAVLVVRDRAGCRPVPGTDAFARYARQLVDLAQRAHQVLARPGLTVGASSNIGTYLVHPSFSSFPHADSAKLVVGSNGHVADELSSGGVDVALMEWWDGRPSFTARPWRHEELVVIVGRDHRWSTRRTVNVADLAQEAILGGEPQTGTGTLLRERLGDVADELRISMNLGSTEAVKRAVRHGLGISLVLAGAVRDEIAAGTLHALTIRGTKLRKTLWAIRRNDEPTSSLSYQFVEHLVS
jgi:DNA-binding transcriptional LysR family regulator